MSSCGSESSAAPSSEPATSSAGLPDLCVAIVTLFPELFEVFLRTSFVGRASRDGRLSVHLEQLRDQGIGRHRSIDDTPYGGGVGMVMRVNCTVAAIECAESKCGFKQKGYRVLLTPQGQTLNQTGITNLLGQRNVVLVCGRYEGFDERVRSFVDQEISLGDCVMMGGEIPAMAIIEACVRLLPGVLGNQISTRDESFSEACSGLLEYPQYTRPLRFRGVAVPEVLRSGDHAQVNAWRRSQSRQRTLDRRPDLVRHQSSGDNQ